jgi:hypothetical protein
MDYGSKYWDKLKSDFIRPELGIASITDKVTEARLG